MARQALAVLEELSAELTADVTCWLRARGCSRREGRLASLALLGSSPVGLLVGWAWTAACPGAGVVMEGKCKGGN